MDKSKTIRECSWAFKYSSRNQYYSSKYKRKGYEIQDHEDCQPCRMFLKEEIATTIMMDTRTTKAFEFRAKFKIDQRDLILTKEQSIGSKKSKSISKRKNKGAVFCFKQKN